MSRASQILITVLAVALGLWIGPASALQIPEENAPIPQARPATGDGGTGQAERDEQAAEGPVQDAEAVILKDALDALASGDISATRAALDRMPRETLDRRILAWAIAVGGAGGVSSEEIGSTAAALPDWPGAEAIRRNLERALARENPPANDVLAALGSAPPLTAEGTMMLAGAYLASERVADASAILAAFWRTTKLSTAKENAILARFGALIPRQAHCHRLERMMYENRIRSAGRVASLCGRPRLHEAWAAVIRREDDAYERLSAVPQGQRTAGFTFALAHYLRRAEKFREAAAVMLDAPSDPERLVDPDRWWIERRVLSRELLDIGEPALAYEVAAGHDAASPTVVADAEFHAGWYALRFRDDPATASKHFARIAAIADGPISNARAYYWLARAAEAGGPGDARDWYKKAARRDTAFYGQIAAQTVGRKMLSATRPEPSAADRNRFEARETVRAIRRLEAAGHAGWANSFYVHLARKLDSVGEIAQLAAMAEERGDHYLALRIGKGAAARGLDIGALAHPLGAIPPSDGLSPSGMALAYAVARQESEFNAAAVSPAGARGLLQLMPRTARGVARSAGLAYSAPRLTSDAAYNVLLGSNYLAEQLARFDGSYVLTFAGYNAGPRKAKEWVSRFGDPRGKSLEFVVDWIERIPYGETRNYVQRVMENYEVYKQRIAGRFDIIDDLRNGR